MTFAPPSVKMYPIMIENMIGATPEEKIEKEDEIDYAGILKRTIDNPFIPIQPGTTLADLIGTPARKEKPQEFVSSPNVPPGIDTPEGDSAIINREIRFKEEKKKSRLERKRGGLHSQSKYRNGNG